MESTESKWVPWLDGILVKDCYVVQDLEIKIAKPGQQVDAPRHLILTGRNGSGKSSILRALDRQIHLIRNLRKWSAIPGGNLEFYQQGNWHKGFPKLNLYTYGCFYTDRNSRYRMH